LREAEQRYRYFLDEVASFEKMYALKSAGSGWATSSSADGRTTILLWSSDNRARRYSEENGKAWRIEIVGFDEFMTELYPAMIEYRYLVGPNWYSSARGAYVEPLDIKAQLFDSTHVLWDVFLSLAGEDRIMGHTLTRALRRMGLRIWLDRISAPTMATHYEDIEPMLRNGIVRSRAFIILLSKAYLAKEWPRFELDSILEYCRVHSKPVVLIWGDASPADVHRINEDWARLLDGAAASLECKTSSVEDMASAILSTIGPVTRFIHELYLGKTTVIVDNRAGEITIWNYPATAASPMRTMTTEKYEFSGLRSDWGHKFAPLVDSTAEIAYTQTFDGIRYAQINRRLCEESQIKPGMLVALPPFEPIALMRPLFVCDHLTIGDLTAVNV